jgi:oxygen-independent coproporphyrinogen-3 oxidase
VSGTRPPRAARRPARAGPPSAPATATGRGAHATGWEALAAAEPTEPWLGLYIHVPFCARRCHFCSFATAPLRVGALPRYLDGLHREIELAASLPWAGRVGIETIFLGGGTPSLLAPAELGGVLDRARARFPVHREAEVTVEATPETVTRQRLDGYREAGVTRLSLGVEALDDAILARLGRLHTAAGAGEAFATARAAGIDQVSVDLMYGLPGLDLAGWRDTVERVLDWEPDHLSAYALTLDAGSRWGSTGVPDLPTEDTVVEQYWALARAAAAGGWEHYEISNYARPGCRSRHNQVYWQRREYLALGPAACGFVGDLRYQNVTSVGRWLDRLAGGDLPVASHEHPTPRQQRAERLILGLRTRDGVPAAWLAARAVGDHRLVACLDAWREAGLLVTTGDRARLTERGFLLSDGLFVELL